LRVFKLDTGTKGTKPASFLAVQAMHELSADNFGFSAFHIKVYKGDSNAAGSTDGSPAEQVLAEELEAPGGPEDFYSTNSSLSREMRVLGPAFDDVDLRDTEEADITVV